MMMKGGINKSLMEIKEKRELIFRLLELMKGEEEIRAILLKNELRAYWCYIENIEVQRRKNENNNRNRQVL